MSVKLFGSSGIRGILNGDINPDLFLRLGFSVGNRYKSVAIGRDPRLTGEMLAEAFIAGLLSAGADVVDMGVVSTPTLAHAARNYECGVIVTASHNPPEYNGLKLWNPSGLAFDEEQEEAVENMLFSSAKRHLPDWRHLGRRHRSDNAVGEHIDFVVRSVGEADIKVVVDCANGPTSTVTPYVLREMGCNVVALNSHIDGSFPSRNPEPTEENLEQLKRTVTSIGADLGIAHDGDGDRMVAVDEKGNYAGGDKLLPLFAKVHGKKGIAVPVDASMILDDMLPSVKIWRTRVGDVYVAQAVKKHGADFGGEPSGTWIFPHITLCPDGVLAAALLAELVSERKLSERLSEIPFYPMQRGSFTFDPSRRETLRRKLEKEITALRAKHVDTTDGWRLEFDDGWALVRFSGTEPKLRVSAEAREQTRAKEIYANVLSMVERVVD